MLSRNILLLTGLLLCAPVAVAKDATQAERVRLSDEIERLVERQVWSGVERKFLEMEKLDVELTQNDYLNGAYAARELGDVASAYERLKRAAQIKGTKEIIDWLWEIDTNYGSVQLVTVPKRSAELTSVELPFDVNQRKAVERAISTASADGRFDGMLPKGDYVFAGQPFAVEPGVSVRIEVSPRARRQGIIEPVIIYRDEAGGIIAEP